MIGTTKSAGTTTTGAGSANGRTHGAPNTVSQAVGLELFAVGYFDVNGAPHDTLVVRTATGQVLLAPDAVEAERWVRGLREPSPAMVQTLLRVLPPSRGGGAASAGGAPAAPAPLPRETVDVLEDPPKGRR